MHVSFRRDYAGKVIRVRMRHVLVAVAAVPVMAMVLVLSVCVVALAGPAGVERAGFSGPAGSFAARGVLNDVAALSAQSAWAVGRVGLCQPRSLIARWNGRQWEDVAVPAGARRGWLNGVAVTSPRNAWAVGFSGPLDGSRRSLLLHWDGTAWRLMAHPGATGGVSLAGVAATSARHAWAVGYTGRGKIYILRSDGRLWWRVHVHSPTGAVVLDGIAATSARNVWVVGMTSAGLGTGLIMHWNGSEWTQTPLPGLPSGSSVLGVAATSTGRAWAVGVAGESTTLILRWNGRAWRRVAGSSRAGGLTGVAAASPRGAWAVGGTSIFFQADCSGLGTRTGMTTAGVRLRAAEGHRAAPADTPLVFHWNGKTWRLVASPAFVPGGVLLKAAATSVRNAWAVGARSLVQSAGPILLLRWNGRTWK